MTAPSIYLYFSGNCEQAINFYETVLGGDITLLSRYKDMPPSPDYPPIADEFKEYVMHSTLNLGDGNVIQCADLAEGWGPPLNVGNNFAVSLSVESRERADKIHAALSTGGRVTMAMQDTFWKSYFGTCTDQYGVNWMIAYPATDQSMS